MAKWFEEGEHPRAGRGDPRGGQFVSKGGSEEREPDERRIKRAKQLLSDAAKVEVAKYKKHTTTSLSDGVVRPHKDSLEFAEQEKALAEYSIAGNLINPLLRNGEDIGTLANTVQKLDALMAQSSLSDDVALVRLYRKDKGFEQLEFGDALVDKGFISTSLTLEAAQFATSITQDADNVGQMLILAPKGSKALAVYDYAPTYAGQQEVLIARNSRLEYLGDDEEGTKVFKLQQQDIVELASLSHVKSLRPDIVAEVQKEYDDWGQDDEGFDLEVGSGGICDRIAERIGNVLAGAGIDTHTGGQEGDDHAWIIANLKEGVYFIDVPPGLYEQGAGYNWKKIENVKFEPDDVVIEKIDKPMTAEEFDRQYGDVVALNKVDKTSEPVKDESQPEEKPAAVVSKEPVMKTWTDLLGRPREFNDNPASWKTAKVADEGFYGRHGVTLGRDDGVGDKKYIEQAIGFDRALTDIKTRFPVFAESLSPGMLHTDRSFLKLTKINLVPGRKAKNISGGDTFATYNYVNQEIEIAAGIPRGIGKLSKSRSDWHAAADKAENILHHELGHAFQRGYDDVAREKGYIHSVKAYYGVNDKRAISMYARTSYKENFAESFAAYAHPDYANSKIKIHPELERAFGEILRKKS